MPNSPSISQVIRFCFSYKFFPFIPFLTDIVLPSSIQQKFVLGVNSAHPFYIFDIFLLLFIIHALSKNKVNHLKPDLILLIVTYVILVVISAIVNNFYHLFVGLHYCVDFILYAFLFRFVTYNKTEVSIVLMVFRFLIIYLTIQLFLIFFGVLHFESMEKTGILRAGGTAGNANLASHLIYLMCVVSLFGLKGRVSQLVLIIASGLSLFFTLCRGAILAFALFAIISTFLYIRDKKLVVKIAVSLFLFGILYSLNSYFNFIDVLEERQEVALAYTGGDDYTSGRAERWGNAIRTLDMNGSHLFGEGLASTPMHREEILSSKNIDAGKFSPHNVYIAILCETGIITLFIILVIQLITLKRFYKTDKTIFIGILIFYGVSFMTEVVVFTQNFAVLVWFAYYNLRKNNQEKTYKLQGKANFIVY